MIVFPWRSPFRGVLGLGPWRPRLRGLLELARAHGGPRGPAERRNFKLIKKIEMSESKSILNTFYNLYSIIETRN